MAKYSQKVMGKEVGQADVYAEPHTMTGKKIGAKDMVKTTSGPTAVNELCVSVGNMSSKAYPEPKTSGIKIRGTGAATKGLMARGPMA